MAGLVQLGHHFKKGETVVIIFHDHGTRYLGKMYNDDWMRERGFLVEDKPTAGDLLKGKEIQLFSVEAEEPVLNAIDKMRKHNIDQLPVMENGRPVGTITDARLFDAILEDAEVRTQKSRVVMGPSLPVLGMDAKLEEVAAKLGNGAPAVLVQRPNGYGILTKQDIIREGSFPWSLHKRSCCTISAWVTAS
jgi:cystathionine beta-synthase